MDPATRDYLTNQLLPYMQGQEARVATMEQTVARLTNDVVSFKALLADRDKRLADAESNIAAITKQFSDLQVQLTQFKADNDPAKLEAALADFEATIAKAQGTK